MITKFQNIRFKVQPYLDSTIRPNGEYFVMVLLTFDAQRVRISTGESIPKEAWDNQSKRVTKLVKNYVRINARIADICSDVQRLFERLRDVEKKQITPAMFKKEFDTEYRTPPEIPEEYSFFTLFDEFMKDSLTPEGKPIREGTRLIYKALKAHLLEFEQKTGKITFDEIDTTFYHKFTKFLYSKEFTQNTTDKYVQRLKRFLYWSKDKGVPLSVDVKKFKSSQSESDQIALDESEIQKIRDVDLSANKRLSNVRDIFLVQCLCGLRFSDVMQIRKVHKKGQKLELNAVKTSRKLSIPLLPEADAIIERHLAEGGRLPKISNQKMNEYLKELCELSGIIEEVERTEFRGGIEQKIVQKKFELVTTHTGRRSFVTNSLRRGLRVDIVMKLSGHKSLASFKKYIKESTENVDKEFFAAYQ
jgi:integrase